MPGGVRAPWRADLRGHVFPRSRPDPCLRPAGEARALNRLVHLELHTPNTGRACAFYTALLAWQVQSVRYQAGTYLSLAIGPGIEGGVVEAEGRHAFWLPYVEVADVAAAAEAASRLGATVLVPSREGPMGWRAVVATRDSGPVAFWQPKA